MTDDELKQLVAANAQSIQALSRDIAHVVEIQQQTSRDIAHVVETQQEAIKQATEERKELRQLSESNARAIQAFVDTVVTDREETREIISDIRGAMVRLTNVQEGIANLLASLDEDRPTILRKLTSIENKVDRILDQKDIND